MPPIIGDDADSAGSTYRMPGCRAEAWEPGRERTVHNPSPMNHPLPIPTLLVCLLLCGSAAAIAQESPESAASSPPSTVVRVKKALRHGAEAATQGIQKGVAAGVHGVERGAHAAAGGVERGAKAAARGIEHGASATARVTKKVVRKVEGAVAPAPAASQ